MQIEIMSFEESWNLELQKAEFYKDKDIKWQDYFVSEDFLKEDTEDLKSKYRKIYKTTQFEIFKSFIPKWIPCRIILNCGVGGNYNESKQIIYVSVNPATSITTFYNTLMHEYCHIEYNKYLRNMPHDFLEEAIEDAYKRLIKPAIEREIRNTLTERAEEAIEVIAAKKYGVFSFDHKKYRLFSMIDLDNLQSSILKAANKYKLLIKESNDNVFTFVP